MRHGTLGGAVSDVTAPDGPGGTSLLLFVAGEPFRDVNPGGPSRHVSAMFYGGMPVGVNTWGGHEPADQLPGQVYGDEGRTGRMVLEIAQKRGLAVKVVDVDAPGDDEPLVQRYISDDDLLPVLIRPDGQRLSGDESFVPATVERFLLEVH
jgi:hypothetical protein